MHRFFLLLTGLALASASAMPAHAICGQLKELVQLSDSGFQSLRGKRERYDGGVSYLTRYKIANAYDCEIADEDGATDFSCRWVYSNQNAALRSHRDMASQTEKCLQNILMAKSERKTRSGKFIFSNFRLPNETSVKVSVALRPNRRSQYNVRLAVIKDNS